MQTEIVPVAVFPGEATRFFLRSGPLGPPPSYYYQLQSVQIVPGKPGKPAVVDLVTGQVTSPEIAAVADLEVVTVLKEGNASMTEAQWSSWAANLGPEGDAEYQLNCLTANLGLVRA